MDQICPKEVYLVRNRKSEYHHRIKLIQITLDTKFHLKSRQLWLFGLNLPKKIFSYLKRKKVSITIELTIFELVNISNFILHTLRVEIFAGRKFCVFRGFHLNLRNQVPAKFSEISYLRNEIPVKFFEIG